MFVQVSHIVKVQVEVLHIQYWYRITTAVAYIHIYICIYNIQQEDVGRVLKAYMYRYNTKALYVDVEINRYKRNSYDINVTRYQ